jgi:hypothetical protein
MTMTRDNVLNALGKHVVTCAPYAREEVHSRREYIKAEPRLKRKYHFVLLDSIGATKVGPL